MTATDEAAIPSGPSAHPPMPVDVADAESQWSLIWREFRKKRLAVLAAFVIYLELTISIFAPFIANDRPWWFSGVNRFEVVETVRTERVLLDRLADLRSGADPKADLGDLTRSLRLQSDVMTRSLTGDDRERWLAFAKEVDAAVAEPDGAAAAKSAKLLARQVRTKFDANKLQLAERTAFPVAASLDGLTTGLMIACVLFPIALLLSFRLRRSGRRLLWRVTLLLPILVGVVWYFAVPTRLDRAPYKAGVFAGSEKAATAPIVYSQVVWPPLVHGVDEIRLARRPSPPFWSRDPKEPLVPADAGPWQTPYWLGSDELGRDLMTRLIWGGRVSLSVGIVAVSIYMSLGIVIGALAGYFRGVVDLVVSRIIEIVICFPAFFLILTIVALFKPSIITIMVVIGLTGWTGIARLVRGEFFRLVDQEFVLAGRALGYSSSRIIFRHVLPNALAPVLVTATFGIAGAILTESALSFLGLGISVPTPSWGAILATGRPKMVTVPWLILLPGLIIFITITAYNLVGEALRDASDPRLRATRT